MMRVLFYLLVGHFLGDFSLQSSWMAQFKNPNNVSPPPPGQREQTVWPYVLTAHAAIMGGLVALATGSILLGVGEFLCHWAIDFGKCMNAYGIHQDQAAHLFMKLVWWAIWCAYFVGGTT